ncbi:SlyX family protein [Brucepastera parasyntrophica]|uniref:SlyX family protein n=1 Tax=Brucepastera parasyntrophica TaxID=2880008 RepID=UPI00210DC050|nr:SlyX family protein [Brucepastera parasyntrophica]ULQ58928.1 SlyX family protein [Brucepastera parasyntrophica]
MENTQERLTFIETKLAYLEDFVNTLHHIVLEHTEVIDKYKAENKQMREKLEEMAAAITDIPGARPPHY